MEVHKMNDQFHEEVVTQKNQGFQTIVLALATLMMFVMAVVGIIGLQWLIQGITMLFNGLITFAAAA